MIDFREPKLKVKRANQHISDLNREILTFTRKDPYVAVVDHDSAPGYQLLRVKERYAPPEHWPLIIGDAVHNLRSALDIMTCDIMRYHRRGVASVHFPFAPSLEDLEATIERRTVHRARPEIVDVFRELKPYRGGDDFLYAIHDFDVRDKHKLINPVVNFPGITGIQIFDIDGSQRVNSAPGAVLIPTGEERIVIRADAGMKIQYNRKAPFQIMFHEGPFGRQAVVPSLFQMSELVGKIIATFERCINHPRPPIQLGYAP